MEPRRIGGLREVFTAIGRGRWGALACLALGACTAAGGQTTDGGPKLAGDAANRRIIAELRENGADLAKPTNVNFYLYLPREADARRAASDLDAYGFSSDIREPGGQLPDGSRADDWLDYATIHHVVTVGYLRRIERLLGVEAKKYRGHYDGWDAAITP